MLSSKKNSEKSIAGEVIHLPVEKSASHLREKYLKEKTAIEQEFGTLEDIRARLNLSRRRMCQLLLVDPSAWTRWTKNNDGAPPHIYQALKWYIQLTDKLPTVSTMTANIHQAQVISLNTDSRVHEISDHYEKELTKVSNEIEKMKNTLNLKEEFVHTIKSSITEGISRELSHIQSQIQSQQSRPLQMPQVDSLKYETVKIQNQIHSLENILKQMRESINKQPSQKLDFSTTTTATTHSAQTANKFMLGTLIAMALGGLVYLFLFYF